MTLYKQQSTEYVNYGMLNLLGSKKNILNMSRIQDPCEEFKTTCLLSPMVVQIYNELF